MEEKQTWPFSIGDLLGGFAGAAVALPQSIGLGVLLFTAMGMPASAGALAGLMGLIILQFVVGGFGATIGIINAPNGPMTMLLMGVMGTLSAQGSDSQLLLLTLSAILLLTGVFQVLFALLGGTGIIKYIPYPVIAGLIAGVGIQMLFSQISLLAKDLEGKKLPDTMEEAFGFAVASITMLLMIIVPRLSRGKVPPAVAGLVGGTLIYFLLLSLLPVVPRESWVVGVIPSFEGFHFGFPIHLIDKLPLETVLTAAAALTLLGTVDSLVTSLVADSKTGARHSSRKEIVAQGTAEIFIGLSGALGGWGTKGATLVATDAGGRRWAPIVAGMIVLVLLLFAGGVGEYLPISVLAGIVAMVGIGMVDRSIFGWLKRPETRLDGVIALLVVTITLSVSLVVAVGIGMAVAMGLFLYREARRPIVHRHSSGTERRSNFRYPKEATALLDRFGEELVMYELRGDLFFGTADRLRRKLEPELERRKTLILHLRRVDALDLSAVIVLLQLGESARKQGCELVYCHLHEGLGFGRKVHKAFSAIDSRYQFDAKVFADGDSAFEYAERKLLKEHGYELDPLRRVPPEENDLFKRMSTKQRDRLLEMGRLFGMEQGTTIYRQGELGESLYLLVSGEVELRLAIKGSSYKRVVKYGPGAYFGELAFIEPRNRSADAVAVSRVELMEFRHSDLVLLEEKKLSKLSRALITSVSRSLIEALDYASREIRRLEEW
ncbi:SLC26A/SulP transporter family protein [Nitratifractor sp.]